MEPTTTPLLPGARSRCGWLRRRLRLKNPLSSELSGAVGDLGTFIPIVLTLTLVSNLDLSATLIFTGFYNIATGLLFDIPMPVQPMKSIAAVAVSESPHLTPSQIAAAGASTAATLLLLGATRAMSFLYNLIPLPVVRGVQLSQGLQFAFSAIKYVRYNYDTATLKPSSSPRSWLGLDGLKFGPSKFHILRISWEDWKIGFVRAAIPQIPLSVLNSVIAVYSIYPY